MSYWDSNPSEFDREFGVSTKGCGLLNSVTFPLWKQLTNENDPSMVYYTDPWRSRSDGVMCPRRHWSLLSELRNCEMVGMPMDAIASGSSTAPVMNGMWLSTTTSILVCCPRRRAK